MDFLIVARASVMYQTGGVSGAVFSGDESEKSGEI